jgi:5-carboxymethyl-2-hydroxymuconate isomerase
MPHLTLEHTANIPAPTNPARIMQAMHDVLYEVGAVKIENCKSRIKVADPFFISRGEESGAFLHLDIRLIEGRTVELKQAIGNGLLDVLKGEYEEAMQIRDVQITVEIRDIQRDHYFKYPEGSLTQNN